MNVYRWCRCQRHRQKIYAFHGFSVIAGVVDTSDKFIIGVVVTDDQFFTGVVVTDL
jgi:hypothetical protein